MKASISRRFFLFNFFQKFFYFFQTFNFHNFLSQFFGIGPAFAIPEQMLAKFGGVILRVGKKKFGVAEDYFPNK